MKVAEESREKWKENAESVENIGGVYEAPSDVVIVGSGLAGLSSALALLNPWFSGGGVGGDEASAGDLTVTLISAEEEGEFIPLDPEDVVSGDERDVESGRLLAVAARSADILARALTDGPWNSWIGASFPDLVPEAEAIRQIRVVDRESTAKLDFHPEEIRLGSFGYMVDEFALKTSLRRGLWPYRHRLRCLGGQQVVGYQQRSDGVEVVAAAVQGGEGSSGQRCWGAGLGPLSVERQQKYNAKLILACDGRGSSLRKLAGIGQRQRDFKQISVVFDIHHPQRHHRGVAVQKFRGSGPLAILPKLGGYHSGIVWTEPSASREAIEAMTPAELLPFVEQMLGGYLGQIEIVTPIKVYPLHSLVAESGSSNDGVILVGDAFHSIHPVAGQGFNLGLRDIECLVGLLKRRGLTTAVVKQVQSAYNRARQPDVQLMDRGVTFLEQFFISEWRSAKLLRQTGLRCVDKVPWLNRFIAAYASHGMRWPPG